MAALLGRSVLTSVATLAIATAVAGVAVVAGLPTAAARSSRTAYVAPAGRSSGADTGCATARFASVQRAVDAVGAGGTVHLCPGTYTTQVRIAAPDVTLEGAGRTSVIAPHRVACAAVPTSGVRPQTSKTAAVWAPIVEVTGRASGVRLSDLQVDGAAVGTYTGTSAATCGLAGVFFDRASGSVVGALVEKVRGLHDQARNVGIDVLGGDATVTGTKVSGYGSIGIVCNGPGTACTVSGDAFSGLGAIPVPQTGIQLSGGARGSVRGNTVEDNELSTATTEGIGILLFDVSGVPVDGNTLRDDQAAIVAGSFGKAPGAVMTKDTVTSNKISYDDAYRGADVVTAGIYVFADAPGSMTTDVDGNTISGPGVDARTVAGLEVGTIYSYGAYHTAFGYGAVTVTAADDAISGWHVDAVGAGARFTARLHDDDLLGGVTATGVENVSRAAHGSTAAVIVDATGNWWGCAGGPGAPGCATASGSVDDRPWLTAAPVPPG